MDHETMIERLNWLAIAGPHATTPNWLAPNTWGEAISEVSAEALAYIERLEGLNAQLMETLTWRPIAEAPVPAPGTEPDYKHFPFLVQDDRGHVSEGYARYVTLRGKPVLRWYAGAYQRLCPNAKYFMPLPAKRED